MQTLKAPTVIIAGEGYRFRKAIGPTSSRISNSTLHRVRGAGHMVHQTATNRVMSAIDEAMKRAEAQLVGNRV
jgi:pimeloyl-ACP methyl ester carboxylesterase